MNNTDFLIYLAASALRKEKASLFNEVDMSRVFSLARRHRIEALVFGALPEGTESDLYERWEQYRNRAVIRETIIRDETEKLLSVFEKEEINALALKGSEIKYLYPEPYMRHMGDIDILYDGCNETKIKELLVNIGYVLCEKHDGELVFEKKPVILLEMHKRLCAKGRAGESFFNSFTVSELKSSPHAKEISYLYALLHTAHHYYSGGTGIRNIIDIYLLSKTPLDFLYINEILKKLGYDEFGNDILSLGDAWFGGGEMTKKLSQMGDYIIYSGVGGRSETRIKRKKGGKSAAAYIASRLFPSPSEMKRIYPRLCNHTVLLPLFWLARPFTRLIRNPKKVINELKAAINSKTQQ